MNSAVATRVATWLKEAKQAVIFTGAGISTESGIPDFRSPGGIWSKHRTIDYEEFMASAEARCEYWQQKAIAYRDFVEAQPNAGHEVIAKWQREGSIHGVITQNIDGLHQIAGNTQVLELHGTARQVLCQDCGVGYDAEPLVAEFLATHQVPACRHCANGRLKQATISFGQALSSDVLEQAVTWCQRADLLLAIGSSLVVSPAAELPALAKKSGGRLVIINREVTPVDVIADDVIHESIGATLTSIDARYSSLPPN